MEWKFVEVLLCVLQFSRKNDNYLCAKNKDKIKTEKKQAYVLMLQPEWGWDEN